MLWHIWKDIPCLPNPIHVYEHQDKKPGKWTPLEKSTCIWTKEHPRTCAQIFEPIQDHRMLWNEKGFGLVKIEGTIMGGAFKKLLYNTNIGHRQYVTYLSNKWDHDAVTLREEVVWPLLFTKARKATRHHLHICMSKWLVGQLPTGTVMKKWKQRIHAWCSHCQQDQEDILHSFNYLPFTSSHKLLGTKTHCTS